MKKSLKKIQYLLPKGFSSKIWVLAGNIGGAGLGFLSFVFLAQYLTQEQFGKWLLYLAGFSLFEMLRTGVIYQALVQKLTTNSNEAIQKAFLGGAWWVMIYFSSVVSLFLWVIHLFFSEQIHQIQMELFFQAYPIALWAILPMNMTMWRANAEQKFRLWSLFQILPNALFLIFIPFVVYLQLNLYEIVIGHTFFRGLLSVFYLRYSAIHTLWLRSTLAIKQLMNYGKYSLLSTLGTHLLKSSDVFIVGYFWGAKSVALYNLPLKLIELAEIPLRAFSFTAFPQLAQSFGKGDIPKTLQLLKSNLIFSYVAALPLIIGMLFFSNQLVVWVGGVDYQESVWIFRLFLIYLCILPLDRLLGVTLDSVNLPNVNSQKVWIMLIVNILGDVWVILWMEQLWALVWVSILNCIIGVCFGLWHLRKVFVIEKRIELVY